MIKTLQSTPDYISPEFSYFSWQYLTRYDPCWLRHRTG